MKIVQASLLLPGVLLAFVSGVQLFWVCYYTNLNLVLLIFAFVAAAGISFWVTENVLYGRKYAWVIGTVVLIASLSAWYVYMTNFNEARSSSARAEIRSDMNQMFLYKEMYKIENNTLEGLCSDKQVKETRKDLLRLADKNSQQCMGPVANKYTTKGKFSCNADENSFAMEIFVSSDRRYICIDDTGQYESFVSIEDRTQCEQ